ncbi:hypothetical protein [Trinickia mobilis]|uniref:hypothetical protein n=1 Tax=Trinickia mobilis TaxID=2816356 RepID=UPI001F5E0FF0|nr:hypothetical protein [Trinickia mobilis]
MSRLDIQHTKNVPAVCQDGAHIGAISVLRPSLILLFAAAAGISAGSIYFSQPVLGILGASFSVSTRIVGFIPTLTQLGYAFGILLLAPLGDRYAAPIHLGSDVAGMYALAGAAGSVAAPVAGKLADRRGPEIVTRVGCAIVTMSFASMILSSRLSPHGQLIMLAVCTAGFDLWIQATLIAHQTIVYGIEPGARSRLIAVLFVGMFLGMAIGAGVGSAIFDRWGWGAVTMFATLAALGALATRLWPVARESLGR